MKFTKHPPKIRVLHEKDISDKEIHAYIHNLVEAVLNNEEHKALTNLITKELPNNTNYKKVSIELHSETKLAIFDCLNNVEQSFSYDEKITNNLKKTCERINHEKHIKDIAKRLKMNWNEYVLDTYKKLLPIMETFRPEEVILNLIPKEDKLDTQKITIITKDLDEMKIKNIKSQILNNK